MAVKFTQKAQNALSTALQCAKQLGHSYVGSEHLLLGLLSDGGTTAGRFLQSHGFTFASVNGRITEAYGRGIESTVGAADMTPRMKKILESAGVLVMELGRVSIGTEHVLSSLLDEVDCVAVKILVSLGADPAELRNELNTFLRTQTERTPYPKWGSTKRQDDAQIPGAPILSAHGRNLTELAAVGRLDPVAERQKEMERVIRILVRRSKNNPCLVGEAGVGKTAVAEGLAQLIHGGNVPDILRDRILVTLDVASMVAGAKYRGEFEERLKAVMGEIRKNPRILLFIDEIHTIVGAGAAEGAIDAANILKPALARGEIQIIGATTAEEYRRHIEKDPALERRFQSVVVEEPSEEGAVRILKALRPRYEEHHRIRIADEAIEAAVSLSARYIRDRFLPDKAIDLIDEAASGKRIRLLSSVTGLSRLEEEVTALARKKEEAILSRDFALAATLRDRERTSEEERQKQKALAEETRRAAQVTEADVRDVVTQWTGIPVARLAEGDGDMVRQLSARLRERVIGQDEAVEAVAQAIRRGRVGVGAPNRPLGSFLFLGPSGVGKTELAKAVAEMLYHKDALIRLDMSEYTEKHSVSKLIGSPPGYVGYEDGGYLTERVRRHPHAVVLFDEIEKAHGDLFHLLLQILEDGVLTDAHGKTTDFRNTILIMTSNLGTVPPGTVPLGFSGEAPSDAQRKRAKEIAKTALKQTFRPEFLNRIDEILLFSPLDTGCLTEIARRYLSETARRMQEIGIEVCFDDSVLSLLLKAAREEACGARPLRRAVTKNIVDTFSDGYLANCFAEGDRIVAYAEGGEVHYRMCTK